jgi:hypothetical protein
MQQQTEDPLRSEVPSGCLRQAGAVACPSTATAADVTGLAAPASGAPVGAGPVLRPAGGECETPPPKPAQDPLYCSPATLALVEKLKADLRKIPGL